MKVVQLLGKAWPETTVLFSSMAYLIIRIVADVNKIHLPTWFESFDIPTISVFLIIFILLYRSEEKDNKR
ncbi:bacteriocin immunity protein [Streptococcus oralis]|uniref:Bacteriocin immunity protein n=1 Tax=Streptococcus oralis subsp. dentisani TaxID=1458253 RepID=A0A1X1IXE7_STROR|nr:bacteriocin immunity protein [Streptococcus oralis]ORO77764.1 bacteriocin immunity protein [Streptococcus oralis subsp. dentisani]ORO79735.1 bacteriocin immunity protein [Streptococcus oralis subsp. dentisani]